MSTSSAQVTPDFPALLELNRECYCFAVQPGEVAANIVANSDEPDMAALLAVRPNYFATTGVFIATDTIDEMLAQVAAIEKVVNSEPYQTEINTRQSAEFSGPRQATAGVFMGYDFHLTTDGPKLIEINSNAGGAYIVAALERALGVESGRVEDRLAAMFRTEWQLSGRSGLPRTLAIVDSAPQQQFHYPDMRLAAQSLRQRGLQTYVADPAELSISAGKLFLGEVPIDVVYNRLTDFMLTEPANAIIRQALMENAALVTPAPQHHGYYADKRNLTLLSDPAVLRAWGFDADVLEPLARLPGSVQVKAENSEALWANRRAYFFKPAAGYGSRAAYRGAKLTSRVWQHITSNDYIAQEFVAPPLRAVTRTQERITLKYDLRVYTYAGKPLLWAARVYQGQTTNLRTAGGGLAVVIPMQPSAANCATADD